jgi:uncharacterized membrane protein YhaH (DUF805 family)/rRNA maturation protein Nop10
MGTIEKIRKCPFCGEEILTVAKKCKHCGEWLTEQTPPKTKACPFCAEEIDENSVVCPVCKASLIEQAVSENISKPSTATHDKNSDSKVVSGWFMNYFVNVIRFQYADFNGTATRKEYWIYSLLYYSLVLVGSFVAFIAGDISNSATGIIISIIGIIGNILSLISVFILCALVGPSLAIAVRRLHDTGKSGWWLLIGLIPTVGNIWLLVLLCQKGKTANKKVSATTNRLY